MKKILMASFLILNLNADGFYEPNSKSFRDGFETGLKALSFQAKTDGYQNKIIKLNKPYLLSIDIKTMPLSEALFLQIIANKEGFDTHLTKDFLALGEFDRMIDAKNQGDILSSKLNIDTKLVKVLNNQKELITYPFLFDDFYKKLLNDAESSGVILVREVIEKQPQVIKPKPSLKPQVKKVKEQIITLKNQKAMSYFLANNDESKSSNYADHELKSGDFEYEKTIKTHNGETFIKVKNKNLYFSDKDVFIKDKQ